MRTLAFLAVPWLFVAAIAAVFATFLWPRLTLPSVGSSLVLVVVSILAGPYVVAALVHTAEVVRGRGGVSERDARSVRS